MATESMMANTVLATLNPAEQMRLCNWVLANESHSRSCLPPHNVQRLAVECLAQEQRNTLDEETPGNATPMTGTVMPWAVRSQLVVPTNIWLTNFSRAHSQTPNRENKQPPHKKLRTSTIVSPVVSSTMTKKNLTPEELRAKLDATTKDFAHIKSILDQMMQEEAERAANLFPRPHNRASMVECLEPAEEAQEEYSGNTRSKRHKGNHGQAPFGQNDGILGQAKAGGCTGVARLGQVEASSGDVPGACDQAMAAGSYREDSSSQHDAESDEEEESWSDEEDKSAKTQEQHSGKRKATGGGGKAEQIREELQEVVDKARVDNAKVNQLKALPDMGAQVNYVAKHYMLERYPFLLGLSADEQLQAVHQLMEQLLNQYPSQEEALQRIKANAETFAVAFWTDIKRGLSDGRQYVQTRGHTAVKSKWPSTVCCAGSVDPLKLNTKSPVVFPQNGAAFLGRITNHQLRRNCIMFLIFSTTLFQRKEHRNSLITNERRKLCCGT